MTRRILPVFCAILWAGSAHAVERSMRATITGGGGDSGKCTIEVVVDGSAQVEVSGDSARLVTLAGNPAEWRRFQCNSVMPRNPVNFRFSGVDGRATYG